MGTQLQGTFCIVFVITIFSFSLGRLQITAYPSHSKNETFKLMQPISLNLSFPRVYFWLNNWKPNEVYTICSENNPKLWLWLLGKTSNLSKYYLFDSKGMDKYVSTLHYPLFTNSSDFQKYESSSSCLTIHKDNNAERVYTTVVIEIPNVHGNRCPITHLNSTVLIKNPFNEPCEIDYWTTVQSQSNNIHATFTFNIKNVSTTSDIIFKSQLNKREFFPISQKTINRWANIQFCSPVINFELPPHAFIVFKLKPKDDYHSIMINKIGSGLITSSSYGGVYEKGRQLFVLKLGAPYVIRFTLLFTDKNEKLILQNNNKKKLLTVNSTATERSNSHLEIHYEENVDSSDGFLLEYSVSELHGGIEGLYGNFGDEKTFEEITPATLIPKISTDDDDIELNFLKPIITLALSVTVVIVLLAFLGTVGFCMKQNSNKNEKSVNVEGYKMLLLKNEEPNDQYFIPRKNIRILNKIAEGVSSDVYIAIYENGTSLTRVALKNLKISFTKEDILKEVKVLCGCKHANIVTFIGWMEQENGSTSIITEYLSGGDLDSYLKNPEKLLMTSTVFSYIFQILDAMIYLSHKHILHRDLAARNCLLNGTYEILKITDFGLAREMDINYEYVSEGNPRLPIRWLPLEAFESPSSSQFKTFTYKGDIWSFGILIWEIFSRGKDMYIGLNLQGLIKFLKAGNRLLQPEHCPAELYELMMLCWNEKPEKRPTFDKLQKDIKNIYDQIKLFQPSILNISIERSDASGYERPKKDVI